MSCEDVGIVRNFKTDLFSQNKTISTFKKKTGNLLGIYFFFAENREK